MGRRSAACTAWSRPAASSTRSKSWWATNIGLELAPAEREAVVAAAQAVAAQLPDGDLRTRCTELAHRAETGVVADALLPTLEATLELALQRRPLAQPVLTGVFARTPRGEELAAATREVNAALHSIKGQRLEQVRLTSGPRRYALTLETERVRLQLVLDDAGPRIESAEVG